MTSRPRNILSTPGVPGFLENLYVGRLRWDLIHPFPQQDPDDRATGDAERARLARFLTDHVDPTAVDLDRRLPDGLLDELQERGYLRLRAPAELGGKNLSSINTFRAIETAASWSVPVALVMAIQNAVGVSSFLPALPPGPLHELVRERVAEGIVSGSADTEPAGAANRRRWTTATPVEDGAAYLLNGEKIHIGNGPVTDMISVSAAVTTQGRERIRLFFVDTGSPGFQVKSWHEFMGVKGFPNGNLVFENVRVPADRMLVEEEVTRRLTPELTRVVGHGRMYLIAAPSQAIAKLCAHWTRRFIPRRSVDGRALGEYDAIQRRVAATLADLFAIEAVTEWSLLGDEPGERRANVAIEQNAAKNISSVTAWRVVDRTMSLLAGEGYETAASKARRGAEALPLERSFRDARNFRISGGVDFQIDNWIGQRLLFSYYYPEPGNVAEIESDRIDIPGAQDAELSARNREHLEWTARQARTFARTCLELARRHPDREELFARETTVILLSQIAGEMFTMAAVLARASTMSAQGRPEAQELAEVFCTGARHRLAGLWRRLDAGDELDYRKISDGWLHGTTWDFLLTDAITELPPAVRALTEGTT